MEIVVCRGDSECLDDWDDLEDPYWRNYNLNDLYLLHVYEYMEYVDKPYAKIE